MLGKAIKKVVDTIGNKKKEIEDRRNQDAKLMRWKERLETSMSSHSTFRDNCVEWNKQYLDGAEEEQKTNKIFMSSRGGKGQEEIESNVNITMQLIEGSIDITVPKPAVSAIEEADGMDNRKMVEGILTYMSESSDIQKIVSENERITKKNGFSVLKVMFNPDFNGRTYRGRIETTNPHPTTVIPQPGVSKIEDMDYLFHIENRTIDHVCREYGEEYRDLLEDEGAEYGYLETFENEGNSSTDDMVSVVECWYKDKEGDICLLTWANDTILKDLPKFYYPRSEGGEIEYEEQIELEQPLNVPMQDEAGEMLFDEMGNMQQQQTNIVTVERRVPKRFPFVFWYNIPKEKSIYAVSDCQIIKKQQDSINRMITKEEIKQNKGTTKIVTRKGSGLIGKLKDAESQIVETDDPKGDIQVIDIKTPSNGTYDLYSLQLQAAKDLVGITEASQGRSESATLSGKALETLSANTQYRVSIKTNEKYIAFKELYEIYYEFAIAYYDDKIPYRIEGAAEIEYGFFDKAKLLKQDVAGEFYYSDFDVYINADAGMAKDKNFMIQIADKAVEQGAADAVDYWTLMDSIGVPNASFILERAREKQQMAQQQQQIEAEQAQADKEYERQDVAGKAEEVVKENDELRKQLEKLTKEHEKFKEKGNVENSKENSQNCNTDEIADIISQLEPEEQQQFFNSSPEEQQTMLENIKNM